ncbi:GDP-mannose-dependent alpha-(1-6)-phosphatidylinositol monomannoside mannosyltransferase [Limihaloglobus sulfuriphilus]|uniref:GDP-mannose-dependent alpha-(1-6)-phosphatidylinositol monomannoside mannosyltransferase n=1 Tax=Limihaloglobus sulfuriphilus TaxID=1851148 RepID=A0A1Q2MFI8_9BACT|nr:glycosyltransferase [Limihaloglobus sulfuriphilus]AQQ71318.1 GDP-mannose-dependent alpha-(1-6)-phosphatidylinositol monomannoside mannosyltransferase [Limihaloglobus sulfuriphilus]
MRIAQVMLGRGFGGAERSFVDTSLALAARGHDILAICHKGFIKKELLLGIPNITLRTVNALGEWDFITPLVIRKMLKEFKAEVVHTQLKRAAWHAGRAAVGLNIPVVSKLHNYVKLSRYRYVDVLIATTQDQREYALSNGWPINSVTVVPNFSRLLPVKIVSDKFSKPINFISYGRYVEEKGFHILLKAFRNVIDARVDARLTVGGSGADLRRLRDLSGQLKLDDKVRLGVWIDDVCSALDEADIFVLPSLSESFGIVVLEAMSRGIPLISTLTRGPSQILTEDDAYLVETGSVEQLSKAMIEAATNPEAALSKAGKALELYRNKYYEKAVIPQLEAIYQDLKAGTDIAK